ncbi:MAG: trigger factor [Bdellovibrionota bacterium]
MKSEIKSKVEKLSPLQLKLNIEIPSDIVEKTFNKIFSGIQRDVTIKGFRKGKAPLAQIKSLYADRVKQDVIQDLIQSHYPLALSEHKLNPISYPEFEFSEPTDNQNFSFSALFDIQPEVQLKKYENLEVEKEILDFDPKKVDQVLENIRTSRATFEDLVILRPAQLGDVAMIDFEGFVDDKPLEGGTGTDHRLELGAKQFIDGFEEGVVGMNINETRTLSLKFPDPYQSTELAGKPVQFKVTLKGIKIKVLPELTEEVLKSVGAPPTVEELRKSIQEDLEGTEKKRIEDAFKNRLLKKLVEANPVETPPSLLREQKETLVKDFAERMKQQGMNEADLITYTQKWDSDFTKTAKEMIQASFLVDAIARKHELVCNNEDVQAKLEEYSKQTGIELNRIKEFYTKPEQVSRLTYMITEEKVIAHLMKTLKINEVSKESLKHETE